MNVDFLKAVNGPEGVVVGGASVWLMNVARGSSGSNSSPNIYLEKICICIKKTKPNII